MIASPIVRSCKYKPRLASVCRRRRQTPARSATPVLISSMSAQQACVRCCRKTNTSPILTTMVKQVVTLSEFNKIVEAGGTTVVDFFATWCGPCKVIAPKFVELSHQYKQATFLKVDVDQLQDAAQAHGVRAMPTFLIFKGGKKVATVMGADARELENAIRTHAGPPSQDGSAGHVWGAGNTLGDSATPSKPVSANPTEGVRSLFNQFQGLDPGIKLIAVLAVVYLLYVFVLS